MKILKNKKDLVQPTKVKTGGSTFKNPINQTDKKVWELIKKSVPLSTKSVSYTHLRAHET